MIGGKTLFLLLAGAVTLGAGIWLGQAFTRPATAPALEISGIYLPEPQEVTAFTLTDQNGQPFTQEDFQDVWTFLLFGYTYCPDVCPMTLAELSTVQQRLAQQGMDQDTAYVLISVDPERDTPERLGEYTAYFNKKFQGATGSPAELTKLTRQLGVVYMPSPGQKDKQNYTVDHSATLILIDPDARLHAIFTPPHAPEALIADFLKIRERYSTIN